MRFHKAVGLVLCACLTVGYAPMAEARDAQIPLKGIELPGAGKPDDTRKSPPPSMGVPEKEKAKLLSVETLYEPVIENKTDHQTIELSNEQRVKDEILGSKIVKTERTLDSKSQSGKGFAVLERSTYKLVNIRQDTFRRKTETFGRKAEQERTIAIKTPRWKQIGHYLEMRTGVRQVPKQIMVTVEEPTKSITLEWGHVRRSRFSLPVIVSITKSRVVTKTGPVTKSRPITRLRPVTKTRQVTVYENVTVFDHFEPGKVVGRKFVPCWPFWIDVKTADQIIYRTDRIPKTITETYTEMESYLDTEYYSVIETYSATEFYQVNGLMTKVLSKQQVPSSEGGGSRLYGEVTWTTMVPVQREKTVLVDEPYEYPFYFDKVLKSWEGAMVVTAADWKTVKIREQLLGTAEATVEGTPYEDGVSYLTEESRKSLAAAAASKSQLTRAFTSNTQVGRGIGKISYAGVAERQHLGIDLMAVSAKKQDKKEKQDDQGPPPQNAVGAMSAMNSGSFEQVEHSIAKSSSMEECKKLFLKAETLGFKDKLAKLKQKLRERWGGRF